MAGVIYRGDRGTIQVDTLVLSGRGGTGDMTIAPPSGSTILMGGIRTVVESVATIKNVAKADSGKIFYSEAGGTVNINLAAASGTSGIRVGVTAGPSTTMRVDPSASENIIYSGGAMSNGEYLDVSTGGSLTLVSDGTGSWLATVEVGTLTEETP